MRKLLLEFQKQGRELKLDPLLQNISQWNQSIYEVVTCSRIRILRFFLFKVLQSVFFFNKHLHCHVCVYFDLILKLLSHKKILIFFVGSVFVKTCDEHVIANLQRYRKAYNIIIFLFLMENSIVKIFGSLDVKITPTSVLRILRNLMQLRKNFAIIWFQRQMIALYGLFKFFFCLFALQVKIFKKGKIQHDFCK